MSLPFPYFNHLYVFLPLLILFFYHFFIYDLCIYLFILIFRGFFFLSFFFHSFHLILSFFLSFFLSLMHFSFFLFILLIHLLKFSSFFLPFTISLFFSCNFIRFFYHIYPTPPLGQDMKQSHFLSGV